jgi:hypothetical protein
MRSFWLFRSNLRALEYYHKFDNIEDFESKCHDYYLLMGLWFLKNDYFDEVVIWRLGNHADIVFDIKGKKFIQKWAKNFNETFDYSKPEISFFRGGFQEYDKVTKEKPQHFGLKLYLGAGRRIVSQWNGKYDVYLMEDRRDFRKDRTCKPFYKTASDRIFKPLNMKKDYDICWPCNFVQINYKGQEDFIRAISNDKFLSSLNIVHCGNKPAKGKNLCQKYNVTNIEFVGDQNRPNLNLYLNRSKFGLNNSNQNDGCPRVSTEILMSGTPLLVRNEVRLLPYFKRSGVQEFDITNIGQKIKVAIDAYDEYSNNVSQAIKNHLSFDAVTQKNIDVWRS